MVRISKIHVDRGENILLVEGDLTDTEYPNEHVNVKTGCFLPLGKAGKGVEMDVGRKVRLAWRHLRLGKIGGVKSMVLQFSPQQPIRLASDT